MTKPVKQPIITEKERNQITKYLRMVKKLGYRPWVTVRQSHTIGQGQVAYSWKTKRTHHLLGRGELQPFFHFEHDPNVVDIFDQYPLPIEETMAIAKEQNIVHPGAYEEADDYDGCVPAKTMSTDYVVRYKNNRLHAFNFKYNDSLDPNETSPQAVARTNAKHHIERIFHTRHNIGWTQLSEKSFDHNVTANLKYLRECFDHEDELRVDEQFKAIVLSRLSAIFTNNPDATVREVLARVADDCGISLFQSQCLFQWLTYHNVIDFNWLTPINLNRPFPLSNTEVR
ncbi:TnsA endonuclease N-terminal domain-containing protein [Vibrio rotiferianus]|uniref:TnsA endonuclease N-terminal domain-containing protein n=1 Tax=Vibrio rotiferianus TaxID=190895 RepID=UPI002895EA5E|nr:transposase [Vibrio rotiferianus]CAH1590965.1 transposase [Vibrio rotiferianus]